MLKVFRPIVERLSSKYLCLFYLVIIALTSCKEKRYPDGLSPEESMKTFQLDERFKIELFAAEPHVMDPVSMEFDADGNCYVVEMPDYPYKPEPGEEKGRIRVLIDSNADGRIDHSIVFADKLSEATSILPWKQGLLVTAAPEILYLKDTNGDFKADIREVLFSGFFKNNPETQITSLRLSVDNWIYANNRGQAGEIKYLEKPGAEPISIRGADFRFRLDKQLFEPETGPGQFGQTINDDGHRFFTENSKHINQTVIPWRYTHRHKFMPDQKYDVNISDHEPEMFQLTEPPYWRAERTRQRNEIFQQNKTGQVEYAEDHFSGATGGTFFGGDGFPDEFYGNIFCGEVAGNLVHRDLISLPDNQTIYTASRPAEEKGKEFLSSTDSWFRPTNFTVGPDGYLYMMDYYRQHIETPVSIPDDLKKDMDFMAGTDRGRIYRILPKDSTFKIIHPELSKASSLDLVQHLKHRSQWWRQQAQRLLLERQDRSVIPALKELANQQNNPAARLHAIYLLDALDSLEPTVIGNMLSDKRASMREHGLMMAERSPKFLPMIYEKTRDTVARVALQAALSAGNFNTSETSDVLFALLAKSGEDRWLRKAVLSSEIASSVGFIRRFDESFFKDTSKWKTALVEEISFILAAKNQPEELRSWMNVLSAEGIASQNNLQKAAVASMIKGFKLNEKEKFSEETIRKLAAIRYENPEELLRAKKELEILFLAQ